MSEKNNNIDCGVPRPYSNKKLPVPRYIISEFVKPFSIWSFLFLVIICISLISFAIVNYTNEIYNMQFILLSTAIAFLSLFISYKEINKKDISSVPSIDDVSKTIEYVRAASRLFVLTVISGVITTLFITISHVSDIFYFIDDSTRLTILILMTISFIGSYIMVKTLCSYSSIYENTSLSMPVNISSLPEIITIIGFITPPLLVIFTGLVYNGPPIVDIPFSLSLIDTLVILSSIQILYVALVSRI